MEGAHTATPTTMMSIAGTIMNGACGGATKCKNNSGTIMGGACQGPPDSCDNNSGIIMGGACNAVSIECPNTEIAVAYRYPFSITAKFV